MTGPISSLELRDMYKEANARLGFLSKEDFAVEFGAIVATKAADMVMAVRHRLIAEAVAAEREACAKECESLPRRFRTEFHSISAECAAAIRARGQS